MAGSCGGERGEIAGVKSLKRAFRFFPEFTRGLQVDKMLYSWAYFGVSHG